MDVLVMQALYEANISRVFVQVILVEAAILAALWWLGRIYT